MKETRSFFKDHWGMVLIVCCISCLVSVLVNFKTIINPYYIYGDISFYAIFHRLCSAQPLFTNDLFLSAFDMKQVLSRVDIPIVKWLLPVTILLMKVMSLSHVLVVQSIIFCVIASVLMYLIGASMGSKKEALLLVVLFLIYTGSMDSFYGGAARGSGMAITCAVFYCLHGKFTYAIIMLIPVAWLSYPPILPLVATFAGYSIIHRGGKIRDKMVLIGLTGLMLCFFAVMLFQVEKQVLWKLSSLMEWKNRAGIFDLRNNLLLAYILNIDEHSTLYVIFTGIMIGAILVSVLRARRNSGFVGREFILISAGVFMAVFFVKKEVASRQVVFSIPVFLTIAFWRILLSFKSGVVRYGACMIFALLFLLVPPNDGDIDFSRYRELFTDLSHTPSDLLIAGPLKSLDFVPFFTRQSVFFAPFWEEAKHCVPSMQTELKNRKQELEKILYSKNEQEIVRFAGRNHITHFIVDDYLYAGYNSNGGRPFALQELAHRHGTAYGNGLYLIDVNQF